MSEQASGVSVDVEIELAYRRGGWTDFGGIQFPAWAAFVNLAGETRAFGVSGLAAALNATRLYVLGMVD